MKKLLLIVAMFIAMTGLSGCKSEETKKVDVKNSSFLDSTDEDIVSLSKIQYNNAVDILSDYELGAFDVTEKTYTDKEGQNYVELDKNKYPSIHTMKNTLSNVFSPSLYNKYIDNYFNDGRFIERDGSVYSLDGCRGSSINYKDYEVSKVINKDNGKYVVQITSIFQEGDDIKSKYTEVSDFAFERTDVGYIITEFTFPF